MRQTVIATTYVSSLLIFQPSALPEDYDTSAEAPIDMIFQANEGRRLLWFTTPRGRTFRADVYVDEPVDSVLGPHRKHATAIDQLSVNPGPLYFCGAEFAYRHDETQMTSVPGSGQQIEITPGQWDITVEEIVDIHQTIDQRLHDRTSAMQRFVYRSSTWAIAAAVIMTFVALITIFTFPLSQWLRTSLPAMIGLIVVASILRLATPSRSARRILEEEAARFPDFVAVFQSCAP